MLGTLEQVLFSSETGLFMSDPMNGSHWRCRITKRGGRKSNSIMGSSVYIWYYDITHKHTHTGFRRETLNGVGIWLLFLHHRRIFTCTVINNNLMSQGHTKTDEKSRSRSHLCIKWNMPYLSERSPQIKDPIRTPKKNTDVEKGTFHASPHTRSHCKRHGKKVIFLFCSHFNGSHFRTSVAIV